MPTRTTRSRTPLATAAPASPAASSSRTDVGEGGKNVNREAIRTSSLVVTALLAVDGSNNLGHDFGGQFVFNEAQVEWSAQSPASDFSFTSNPRETSVNV